MPDPFTNVYGLRLIDRFGWQNLLRVFVGLLWVLILVQVITDFRPDLAHPADFGSDTSNYAAAGERLTDASLYRMSPGDRPVSVDNPPDWTVPLLSPPPVAAIWTVMRLLPDPVRFHLLWAIGLGATTALALFLASRLYLVPLLLVAWLVYPAAGVMAWSGNVNALIAPGLASVWFLASPERSRRSHVAAGVVVAICALVKLGPVFLGLWLLTLGRRDAVLAGLVTGVVGVLVTVWLGGAGIIGEYLEIIRETSATASPLSIPGIAASLGIPLDLQRPSLVVAAGVVSVLLVLLRGFPTLTFAIAVVAAVMATTVIRFDTLVVALAALAPWTARRVAHHDATLVTGVTQQRPPIAAARFVGGLAATVGILGIVLAVTTGGLTRSSFAITNDTDDRVIIRFTVPGQDATFGYQVLPGATGVAWEERMGTVSRTILVFASDCRLMRRFEPPVGLAGVRVTDIAVTPEDDATGPLLAYTAACALEARSQQW